MFKKLVIAATALAMGTTGMVAAVPAQAQRYGDYGYGYDRSYRDGYYNQGQRYYRGDRGYYRGDRGYRRNGRGCDNTGGTIVGAIAGGLLGRSVDRRGDRTLGTVLGGAVGALAGNAIDKSDNPRYCR